MNANTKTYHWLKYVAPQLVKSFFLVSILSLPMFFLVAPQTVTAACESWQVEVGVPIGDWSEYRSQSEEGVYCVPGSEEQNVIMFYIAEIIRFLSVGVGLVVTLMIIVGGVQYIGSAGDSQKVEAAKSKIRHAVEALILFIFVWAIINFLIPGGLL